MLRRVCLLAAVLLLFAGCSAPSLSQTGTQNDSSLLQLTDFAGRQISFKEYPKRIVALSVGEADIVYALGGQPVGIPSTDIDLPWEGIEQVARIGNTHEVDLEQITLLRPDVVLGHHPMNAKDVPILSGIGAQVVLTSANSINDIKEQIKLFGVMLGQEARADELVGGIETAEGAGGNEASARALIVYGAPGTFMAALPNSLGGSILEAAGGVNIASDYPKLQSYPQYAALNAERIVEAKPDRIFIMTHADPEQVKQAFVKEMQTNAAWSNLEAVKRNRIEVLPSDLFGSSPGTRIIESLRKMRQLLADEQDSKG